MSNKFWKSFSIVLHVLFDEIEIHKNVFTEANKSGDVELVILLIEFTKFDVIVDDNDANCWTYYNNYIAVIDRLLHEDRSCKSLFTTAM